MLGFAVLSFFLRMPANGGGIKQNLGSLERGQPGGFRIPLIPTDQDSDFAVFGFPGPKPKVARREIKFLEEEGVVRDMHLAVNAEEGSICVDNGRRIMINSGRAL